MKNKIKTIIKLIVLLISINSFCQHPVPIFGIESSRSNLPYTYYLKDVFNNLDPFQGTYIYTNGNTSFKIVLEKKVNQYNGRFYEDLIIGEYQYIENGIEKANTLNQLSTVYNDQRSHNIDGNFVVNKNFREWKCPECSEFEKRLSLSIRDVTTDRYASINMRRTSIGGQEVLKIKISHVTGGASYLAGTPLPASFSLPLGVFTLIKQ